ncbi:alpha-L-fucosidase [Streptomyces cucumeris]|uniref:alpha-L-fucosidase n=1 Tax=Streptomyces cucumeris TaxID=2962890 RepID=UPI003EB6FB04
MLRSTTAAGLATAGASVLGPSAAAAPAGGRPAGDSPARARTYEPTWESVDRHLAAPEWFQDAKFGIYFHWGAFATPAYGSEWYPRNMYRQGSGAHTHHVETYGDPRIWPYHHFITGAKDRRGNFVQFAPRLVSEGGKFDPDEWAQLFIDAGAEFAGPVAEHHDGYSMWDSKANEWNSVRQGPKLDLLRIFTTAFRRRGLKVLAALHHAYNINGYYEYVPAQSDPGLRKLYGQLPRAEATRLWSDKLQEVIEGYGPDIIYQDFSLDRIDEHHRLNFLATYYNWAEAHGKAVVTTYKDGYHGKGEVYDYERGGPADLRSPYWLTDDSVSSSSWCYTQTLGYYSAQQMIHALIDRVSKNGNMLLNIAPRPDGTIPQAQRDVLLSIGAYLKQAGESVYRTRAWSCYGEGPTKMGGGSFTQPKAGTNKDIRFTRNKADTVLYATVLGWPEDGVLRITTLAPGRINLKRLAGIRLLGPANGSSTRLRPHPVQDGTALCVAVPERPPFPAIAYAVKLSFSGRIPALREPVAASVFDEPDYTGPAARLAVGDYTHAQLRAAGSSHIVSLTMAPGHRVTTYPGDRFTGEAHLLTKPVGQLPHPVLSLRVRFDPTAFLTVTNRTNRLVLDGGGRVPAGSRAKVWTSGSSPNLHWQAVDLGNGHHRLVNRTHHMVLDGAGAGPGSDVVQNPWSESPQQQWRLEDRGDGHYAVVNRASGLALDGGGSVASGSYVTQRAQDGSPDLEWRFATP